MIFSVSSLLVPFLFFASVLAQGSFINNPKDGARLRNGQSFTLQVVRPMSHQGSIEVGFAVGLLPCISLPCPPPSEQVGRIMYNGPYRPQLQEIPGSPYQNFTFTIPPRDEFPRGTAQLSTVRLHFIGAGPFPILEFNNITLRIV
ncbi:hypothetical protein FA15DRAFT_666227 [Coprinopsis marcescibilis]|uniref:Phosphatidylglycerol/phosphatidylinositol transfer protein n=1 Tax=Coprinopsis marcescibilis TaxID=230819 RepID=A0A5C3L4L5_COPMA|nr:hypothetical protein FA15DRAFT_666227 [Coprinopsis marcescibilis]